MAVEVAVAVLVLELCLVVLDTPAVDGYAASFVKRLRYENTNNVFREEDFSHYHVNSYGLVGPEPAPLTDGRVYRIAVFGDSFVQALQVPQEYKFTALLEHLLAAPAPYTAVEVWNFGYAGDNTGNAFARWVHQASRLPFALVLFSFNDGDLLENRPQDSAAGPDAYLVEAPDGRFRLDYSRVPAEIGPADKWLKRTFGRLFQAHYSVRVRVQEYVETKTRAATRELRALSGQAARAPTVKNEESAGTAELVTSTYRQLRHVQQEIGRSGTPVYILGLPSSQAMPGRADMSSQRNRLYLQLAARLRESGAPFIDVYDPVAQAVERGEDPYGDWEPGGHFNRSGHALVAHVISRALRADPLVARKQMPGR